MQLATSAIISTAAQQTAEFHPGGTGCPCGTQGGGFGHEAGKGEKESA